jgi:benzoylformate decarboxylase
VPSTRTVVYDLLRELGMTTIFGNPGSTELAFLADFPEDFRYVLALHEGVAVAMADGFAQASGRASFVNLHSASGPGNAMGSIVNAFHNRAPVVIVGGQQDRRHLAIEPYLFAQAVEMVKPYVKWSCEPTSASDVPSALMRAWSISMQQPMGPTFVSVPMDDWDAETEPLPARQGSHRQGADPERARSFASRIAQSSRPVLVAGGGVDRAGGWPRMIALAERIGAPVWAAPQSARTGFPEDHRQFAGHLATGRAHVAKQLKPFDLVVVVGAPVFSYLPYESPEPLPPMLLLTDDIDEAARAPVDEYLVADVDLALEQVLGFLTATAGRAMPQGRAAAVPAQASTPISAAFLMSTLADLLKPDDVLVEESPSNRAEMRRRIRIRRPGGFYASASGGLGFALPGAVGIKMADPSRRVVCLVGDGSALYLPQALWTAAQHGVAVTIVVVGNKSYSILQSFSRFAGLGNVPGLQLSGLDFPAIASGFGCPATRVCDPAQLRDAIADAMDDTRPYLVYVDIDGNVPDLIG